MFVELGQVLSTRSDLISASVATELSRLQDRVEPADQAAVQALLEAELGAPVDTVFAEFDWEPLAAASIGQVHRARRRDGRSVVVKVQRPGIAEAVDRDVQVLISWPGVPRAAPPGRPSTTSEIWLTNSPTSCAPSSTSGWKPGTPPRSQNVSGTWPASASPPCTPTSAPPGCW